MKVCASKLQNSVRVWLKESKLKRFVRDVVKIVKMAKIFNKHRKYQIAREWFKHEKNNQVQNKELLKDLAFDTRAQTENAATAPLKRLTTQKSKIMAKKQ